MIQMSREMISSATFMFSGFRRESLLDTRTSPSQVRPKELTSVKISSRRANSAWRGRETKRGGDSLVGEFRSTPSSWIFSFLAVHSRERSRQWTERRRASRGVGEVVEVVTISGLS